MTDRRLRLLIAEDDRDIASTLSRGLNADGYATEVAHDARSACDTAQVQGCTGAIVDMMLGEDRGTDVVRELRKAGMQGPILILSALSGVDDRTEGLEAGADDYIAKPFEYAELLARLRVQEKRRERLISDTGATMLLGRLFFDSRLRAATNGVRSVSLTEREAELLCHLAGNANAPMTRWEIFDALWGTEGGNSAENVVDVYIGYLRKKLAPMEDFGVALRTIRNRGFILTEL